MELSSLKVKKFLILYKYFYIEKKILIFFLEKNSV